MKVFDRKFSDAAFGTTFFDLGIQQHTMNGEKWPISGLW
jgi:hypothetical protein